jgi:hypothetical protein
MHDQQVERHLRAALRAEGDQLALTITPADLERLAARRRGSRTSRFVGLGLAAAVTIALIGLAGGANHWFENPSVGPSPRPTPSDQRVPTGSPAPVVGHLPSLEDLIGGKANAVVLAQESGPAEGPDAQAPARPMVDLGPVPGPADYEIRYACLGASPSFVGLGGVPPTDATGMPSVTCDGATRSVTLHIDGPERLSTGTVSPSSWRFVVLDLARTATPYATTVEVPQLEGTERVHVVQSASHPDPEYRGVLTGGGIITPVEVGQLPSLDAYRVRVSCAGPSPLQYVIGDESETSGFVAYSTTQVACDGGLHDGQFAISLPHGAKVYVAVDDRDAWNLLVSSDIPPVAIAPDADGWRLMIGSGPDLEFDAVPTSMSSYLDAPSHDIRVVVSCFGGGGVRVDVETGVKTIVHVGSFTAPCEEGQPTTTTQAFVVPSVQGFTVTVQPDAKMWLATTVQERVAASPKP